ncbi:helix-turn-helix domain-containing protein [Mycobacterium intracellulare]|uniref:helix-turn-helix domain-containing protein n=1 Tax=Mycobacterium TaxID=1763 RepID=UPI003AB10710
MALSIRQIASKLGRAPSTVSRELRRNSRRDGRYGAFEAHRGAVQRRARRHAADRLEPCPMRPDRRPARSTVEPATDRPASSLPRRGDLYAVLNFLVADIRGLVISIRR